MTINVDLSQVTSSSDGKYYEAYPAGNAPFGGGNAALGWSAPSGLSQGSSISLTTDGANPFGTGPTNVFYEDYSGVTVGTEVTTLNSNYDSVSDFVRAIGDSDARSGGVAASTFQQHSTVLDYRSASANVDLTSATEVFLSYAVKVPSGSNFPGNDGGSSGTNADYSTDSSWKTSWLYDGATNNDDLVTPSHVGGGIWHHAGNDLGVLKNWGTDPTWWSWGNWNRLTTWVKAGATPNVDAGNLYFQVANGTGSIFEDSSTPVVFASGTAPYQFVTWNAHGWQRDRATLGNVKTLYDTVYAAWGANSAARVELGDNATYSSCTDLHVQHVTPLNWATGQIDWNIDYGPFSQSQDLWLHVTREDNSTRYSIQVTYA